MIRRAAMAMRDARSRDFYVLAHVALEGAIRNEGDVLALLEEPKQPTQMPAFVG
jgi:hypothetical protein